MSRLGRDIKHAVNAGCLERFDVRLWISTERSAPAAASSIFELAAAVTNEHDFDLFLKSGQVRDIVG